MFLDARKREVRLASLLPRNLSSAEGDRTNDQTNAELHRDQPSIRVSLRKVSLDDGAEFTALSYVWGNASDKVPILVDGVEFYITRNLLAALHEFQQDEETVTLWIDALCINQADNEEKVDQIQMMKQIYEAATITVAWLGEDADGSDNVMQMLQNFAARPDFDDKNDDSSVDHFSRLCEMMLLDPAIPTDASHPALKSIQASFKALLEREYWYRVWCVQEFSASKTILIVCGGWRINVEPFHKIVYAYVRLLEMVTLVAISNNNLLDMSRQDSPYLPSHAVGTVHGATRMLEQRQNYRREVKAGQGFPKLIDLLLQAYSSQGIDVSLRATDPRDMVYGLMGLATDIEKLSIRPSYEKTCEEVFQETWSVMLQNDGAHLLVWAQVGIDTVGHATSSTEKLPTWVPDWRQTRWPSNLNSNLGNGGFMACSLAHIETNWVPTENPRVIALEGVHVDTVQETGAIIWAQSRDVITTLKTLLDEVASFLQTSESTHPGDYVYDPDMHREALWRIPLCDIEVRPPGSYHVSPARATTASREYFLSDVAVILSFSQNTAPNGSDGAERVAVALQEHIQKAISYGGTVITNNGRRPFLTPRGWIGLGPAAMKSGDVVAILFGCRMPFVLRPSDEGRFMLLGDAYVHGLMDGEFMQEEREARAFHLC